MKATVFFSQLLNNNQTGLPQTAANPGTISKALTVIFVFIGALAFLILVIAGFRYVVSQGEPAKVAEIKNQIFYALIGLVVAASAAAIVNFVLGRF